jgi:hypothetical protein
LIARKRRGRGPGGKGLSNEYIFLWQHVYEVPKSTPSENYEVPSSGYEVPDQAFSKCQNGDYEVTDSTPPYKEETHTVETHTIETCSSSSSDAETPPAEPKRKKIPFSINGRTPNPPEEPVWYEAGNTMEQAAAIITNSLPRFSVLQIHSIEVPTVVAILKHMTDLQDLQLWLDSARELHASAKSYGRLVTDAAHWPRRRDLTIAVVERSVPIVEPSSEFHEPEPNPQHHYEAEHKPSEPYCAPCQRSGTRPALLDGGMWEWCTCGFADALRLTHPNRVDEDNARVLKLRNRCGQLPPDVPGHMNPGLLTD